MLLNATIPVNKLRIHSRRTLDGRALFIKNGAIDMKQKKDIFEIQKEFGFDKTKPLILSPTDQRDADLTADYYRSWYEEELRELYESE